jgi:S1-C subfamily serine protease
MSIELPEIIKKVKSSIAFIVSLGPDAKTLGTGSGFIFAEKNILVTCHHVIAGSNSLRIRFPDDEEFKTAKVVLSDEEHDLALLKFENTERRPLPAGDTKSVTEGMSIIFSGYPFSSQDLTTHQGIISAILKDSTGVMSYSIDGSINSGNSGCPLMNLEGQVIGVINAKRRQQNDLLGEIENTTIGALSLHGLDIIQVFQALSSNIQLGIGYAVPAHYIPEHKQDVPK